MGRLGESPRLRTWQSVSVLQPVTPEAGRTWEADMTTALSQTRPQHQQLPQEKLKEQSESSREQSNDPGCPGQVRASIRLHTLQFHSLSASSLPPHCPIECELPKGRALRLCP